MSSAYLSDNKSIKQSLNIHKPNSFVWEALAVERKQLHKPSKGLPVKLNVFVSFWSTATEFSSRSHLPTIRQLPHKIVRSITVDPASNPIPTDTWLWAVSVLPDSPDAVQKQDVMLRYHKFYSLK
jgi:hypothetical protein